MNAHGLIDTGAILALLDRSDRWHERCLRALADLPLPLGTSAAVLTELSHLLDPHAGELDVAWRFLHSGAITVLGIDDSDLSALEDLMKKYHDRPMDFADATLVHLARRESLVTVFTVDHADFEMRILLDFSGHGGALSRCAQQQSQLDSGASSLHANRTGQNFFFRLR